MDSYRIRTVTARGVLAALAALALAACGGGGGDGGSNPAPAPAPAPAPPPGSTQVVVSGKATFDLVPPASVGGGLDYGAITPAPIRGASIEALSQGDGSLLASATTDAAGDFSLSVPADTMMRLRIRAELRQTGAPAWNVTVVNNVADDTCDNELYVLDGSTFDSGTADQSRNINAPSGWDGAAYSAARSAGPFAILDAVYESIERVLSVDADATFPALTVKWSPDNVPVDGDECIGQIGTTFYRRDAEGPQIFVLGAENNDTDEYDRHVIIHEWGHYFEDAFSRADSVGGSHSGGDRLDPRVSFSEGWGYAFAGMTTGDPVTRDSAGGGQQGGFSIDVDRNINANAGWYSEGSVQSILYDLFDDDPDGMDAVALGFAPLYETLVNEQADTPTLTTVFSFIEALKANRPAESDAIDALVAAQDIRAVDIDALGSTETNDAGNPADVLPVYTLVAVNGAAVNVCSLGGPGSFGTFNKLSNRRFVFTDLPAADQYRIIADGPAGSDPDIVIHQRGLRDVGFSEEDGIEELDISLDNGFAVIEVYEYTNTTTSPRGRTCIDVRIERL